MEPRKEEGQPVTRIYCDFDGTGTLVPGNELVGGDFYQNQVLADGPTRPSGRLKNYVTNKIFEPKILIKNLKKAFSKKEETAARAPERLTQEFVDFFGEILELKKAGHQIDFVFISKNRKEYIYALLEHEGFPVEDIKPLITVIDIETGGSNKYTAVLEYEKNKLPASHCFTFDDNPGDSQGMEAAAKKSTNNVSSYCRNPGEFKWGEYLHEVKTKLNIQWKKKAVQPENAQQKMGFFKGKQPQSPSLLKQQKQQTKGPLEQKPTVGRRASHTPETSSKKDLSWKRGETPKDKTPKP